jgi:hypothetical protein
VQAPTGPSTPAKPLAADLLYRRPPVWGSRPRCPTPAAPTGAPHRGPEPCGHTDPFTYRPRHPFTRPMGTVMW